jgi:hypothetical protein
MMGRRARDWKAIASTIYGSPFAMPLRPPLRRLRRSALSPFNLIKAWRVFSILTSRYGYLRSLATDAPLDEGLEPCPWYTYPALEYLRQLDFSDKTIFEYGSGHSTLFWSRRAARVVSVEHNREWYERIHPRLPANCELLLEPQSDRYAAAIDRFVDGFDVILIDGLATERTRLKCASYAITRLAKAA